MAGIPGWWGQAPIAGLRVIEPQYRGSNGSYRPYMYDVSGLPRATAWDGYVGPGGVKLDPHGRELGQYYEGGSERVNGGVAGSSNGTGNDLYSAAVNSPWYQQAAAATTAAEAADAASRKSNIQQLLIRFGLVPEGFTDKYGDVDQTTKDLAAANTTSGISAYARLQQAFQDAQRDSSRRLAARGLRRSGTRGYQMRRNQLGYDQGKADAISKVLGTANSVYSQYGQNAYQRQMSLLSALQNAIGSISSFTPPSAPSAPAPAASTSAWRPGELAQVSQDTGYSQGFLGRGRGGEGWDW